MPFLPALPVLSQADTVSPALIAKITYLINRLRDDIDTKSTFARSVERGRRDLLGIKTVAPMIEPQNNAVSERIGYELHRLLRVPVIGMSRNVAGGLSDRELQLCDGVVGEGGRRKATAKLRCKLPYAWEVAESARNFELSVREGGGCFAFDPDSNAGEIIDESLRMRELHRRSVNSFNQCFGLELSAGCYQFDQAVRPKIFASSILRFGESVRVKEEHIPPFKRPRNLLIDFALADAQRHILPLQHLTRPCVRTEMDRLGVSAINKIDSASQWVEAGVTESRKKIEADELPGYARMNHSDNFLGFRKFRAPRLCDQMPEGVQELAFDGGTEQRRWNTFAHDVADENVEQPTMVRKEIVEVAINLLGRDRECGHPYPGQIARRLAEQQRLLNPGTDFNLAFPRLGQILQ
jgi:hypothetical protein